MYRKIVWCYVFILTLLDISLNTKLSAQGKSHGVTVHDSLIEGITFQEWGKDSVDGGGRGAGAGRAVSAGALALSPPALDFGRAALAAAHALTVTLTNTANTTMHLASVAGTTPDFHASFFESKTLPPQANTTFSVVYLGRREGPVSAHLYIHTSLGVHKYPVSAVGVASEWGVWPLVGVRVPLNATVEPLLTMHNPTDQTIQVSEVYSSGAWLGLQLPEGGGAAPRAAWALPPRSARALVRLRLTPHHLHPLTAYIRIKGNMTGGGLVVMVEARPAAAGEYASPLQLRMHTRGSRDPADVVHISVGNSAGAGVALAGSVWAARCAATPPAPPPPPPPLDVTHNGDDKGTANGNGVKSPGVFVSLVRSQLEPHQPLAHAAELTFDYAQMWAGAEVEAGGAGGAGAGAWCGGWVALGRAALPYSVRLLPGTLALLPNALHFVTANEEEVLLAREVRVRNEFPVPVHVARVELPHDVEQYFEIEHLSPLTVGAGDTALVARVWLRAPTVPDVPDVPAVPAVPTVPPVLSSRLALRTNLTDYTLPLLLYSGKFDIEWEWPNSSDGTLRLGAVSASSTRRVRARLRNNAPAPLCVRALRVALPGAQLSLDDCPAHHACRCVEAGGWVWAVLTVVAPARAGAHSGHVEVLGAPRAGADTLARAPVLLSAHLGRLVAHDLALAHAAPYAWSSAPLVLESTMELTMRVVDVTVHPDNPALSYTPAADPSASEVTAGRHTVGTVVFAAEKLCEPDCYTGLDINSPEGVQWVRRTWSPDGAALLADAALQAARYRRYLAGAARANVSLHVHTDHVVQLPARGAVAWRWPRAAPPAADAGLAGVGGAAPMRVRARNPSRSHALLLQPVIAGELPQLVGGTESSVCRTEGCAWALDAFRLVEWRATRGLTREWAAGPAPAGEGPAPAANASGALPPLLLAPDAEVEFKLTFAPSEARALTAYLYLRNNLTILEGVQLSGRGAYPSFELGGRRPGTNAPLLFEVSGCGMGGTVRRTVVARNTGRVGVRLRAWRVAGAACQARGFKVSPCAALPLAPNESRPLTLSFTPDWTLARAHAPLELRWELGRAAFALHAAAPPALLARCAPEARPAWEPALRAAGALLALAALALVLAAAALDAERELRRARHARPPPPARAPLDLRALAHEPQPAPPAVARRPPARRRRPPRAVADPAAERRAFERWRHDVLRRQDDDERSSEDNEPPAHPAPLDTAPLLDNDAAEPADDPPAPNDGYDADPETEDRPQGSDDDDAASTGSGSASASSSSPVADVDEPEEGDERASPGCERAEPARGSSPAAAPRPAPVDTCTAARSRRSAGDTPRRAERHRTFSGEARARPAAPKAHLRKAAARARRERAPSPARSPVRGASPRPAALRWGASWSSVVAARPAALAPIGSDVRRRAEPAPADHSLFYFNGDPTHAPPRDPDFAWRPQPPVDRPTFSPSRDFLDEPAGVSGVGSVGSVGNGSYRSMNSVWGSSLEPRPAASAWLWGGFGEGAAVRPPPGFGAPPRAVRPYDPFRSLASIWAPGARDWRSDDAPDDHH